jgi:hypothetical protein
VVPLAVLGVPAVGFVPLAAVGVPAAGFAPLAAVGVPAVDAAPLPAVPVVAAPLAVVGVPAAGAAPLGVAGVPVVGAMIVLVTATVLAGLLESPASETSAAASAPSESTITTPRAITGPCQRGVAARRVRAAAPQRRHHSCSAPIGAPHSGQPSAIGLAGADSGGGAVATPIRRCPEGG